MADDDDWGITPDYKNVMTEKEQRYGAQAVPGRIGHIDMNELRESVVKDDTESKKNCVPSAAYGYGGKFGVEKDRMDKSAVGTDYKSEVDKHSSQRDYAQGFGGRYGVQTDRQDKNAVGYDYHGESEKHSSQKDYAVGFGGKYGIQKDRVDASSVGYNDAREAPAPHQSQQRPEVTGGSNRASELRARFEKLALDQNKKAEIPERPKPGKLQPNRFPTETPSLQPKPTPVPAKVEEKPKAPSPKPVPPEEPKAPSPKPMPSEEPKAPSPQPVQPKEEYHEIPTGVPLSPPEVAKDEPRMPGMYNNLPARPPSPDDFSEGAEPPKEQEKIQQPEPQPAAASAFESPQPSGNAFSASAVAIYDFQASASDELSFKEGETIVDIVKTSADWWTGRIGSRSGMFPANRVEEISSNGGAPLLSSDAHPHTDITAMALYDFTGTEPGDLSFTAGDEIVDIVKSDEAWWSGRIGDRVGIFPANHVSEN